MEAQEFKLLVNKDTIFIHKEKGHTYKVLDLLRFKHPDTGEWYDGVLYTQLESGELFVRSEESFVENFIVINFKNK